MIKTLILLRESAPGEARVAIDPKSAEKLIKAGFNVIVTPGAGEEAFFSDAQYEAAGAKVETPDFSEPAVIVAVQLPEDKLAQQFAQGSLLIALLDPFRNVNTIEQLARADIDTLALEFIPRITRAQSMDVLSSQASIAGYEGALLAASHAPRFFPMLTTAAGTIRPAKVIVIGAGVAGLQAIATARRLGAVVEAYDIRPDAKEQVESLGAKLIDTGVNAAGEGGYARELTDEEKAQQATALAKHVKDAHAIISTAAIPGKDAPLIITEAMVESMQPGAVIIDIAAETGGNCELTKPGETYITDHGVSIVGPLNLASRAAIHASEMFGQNIFNLLSPFIEEEGFNLEKQDEVIEAALISYKGEIVSPRIRSLISTEE